MCKCVRIGKESDTFIWRASILIYVYNEIVLMIFICGVDCCCCCCCWKTSSTKPLKSFAGSVCLQQKLETMQLLVFVCVLRIRFQFNAITLMFHNGTLFVCASFLERNLEISRFTLDISRNTIFAWWYIRFLQTTAMLEVNEQQQFQYFDAANNCNQNKCFELCGWSGIPGVGIF